MPVESIANMQYPCYAESDTKNMAATMDSSLKDSESLNCEPGPVEAEVNTTELKPANRSREIKTILLLLGMLLRGCAGSLDGTAFVDLEDFLGCGIRTMSLVVPSSSVGSIVGSFICVFKLNRLSADITIGLCLSLSAIMIIMATAFRTVYWLLTAYAIYGCLSTISACEIQPYLIRVWDNHRLKGPVLHSGLALWSLGGALGPIIITPFLIGSKSLNRTLQNFNHTTAAAWNGPSGSMLDSNGSAPWNSNATYWNESSETMTSSIGPAPWLQQITVMDGNQNSYAGHVRYAYILVGFLLLCPTTAFFAYSLLTGSKWLRSQSPQNQTKTVKKQSKTLSKRQYSTLVVFLFLYIFFYYILETLPRSFLTVFVTTFLLWKSPERTLINTTVSGSVCIGRVTGVFASGWLKPRSILVINLTTILTASILFQFAVTHDVIVWIAASMLGFGLSTMYGSIILWMSESITMDQRIIASCLLVASAAGITGPTIVGQLFARYTPMWMAYAILFTAIAVFLVFITMVLLEKTRKKKQKLISNVTLS